MADQLFERLDRHENAVNGRLDKIDATVNSINSTLTSHCSAEDAREKERGNTFTELKHTVWGNGKDGHDKRIDRIERWVSGMRWSLTSVVVPLLIYAGYLLLQKWVKP